MNLTNLLIMGLGFPLCLAAGAGAHALWMHRKAQVKVRLPEHWPLAARGLVTTEEHGVWEWLRNAFPDYLVMVKVPVLRFTIPTVKDKEKSKQWHEKLNGVYCSFTICTDDGKVVACVDVPGKRGLSQSQREMKESLLAECDIPYTSVRGANLPAIGALRAAFLGEIQQSLPAAESELPAHAPSALGEESHFHADLNAFTRERMKAAQEAALKEIKSTEESSRLKDRPVGFNPDGTAARKSSRAAVEPDVFATQWEDSFIMPADTRPAKLD